jgi:hypothetical protein
MRYAIWLALLLLLGCCGCPAAQREPVSLPASWPISQLTLPADATAASLYPFGPGDLVEDRAVNAVSIHPENGPPLIWVVGFHTTMQWDKLVEQAQRQLGPLGYKLSHADPQSNGATADLYAQFDGADGTVVMLHLQRVEQTLVSKPISRMTLKVTLPGPVGR